MKNKRYGPDKPFKTKKEWDEAFENAAQTVADTLNITIDQARVRQFALLESGLMDNYDRDDKVSKLMVDAFLTSPAWENQPKHFGENTP